MSNTDYFSFFFYFPPFFFQEKVMQNTICSLDNNEWRRFMISHVAVTELAPDSVVWVWVGAWVGWCGVGGCGWVCCVCVDRQMWVWVWVCMCVGVGVGVYVCLDQLKY
jgi:hypothetical protein